MSFMILGCLKGWNLQRAGEGATVTSKMRRLQMTLRESKGRHAASIQVGGSKFKEILEALTRSTNQLQMKMVITGRVSLNSVASDPWVP
jgi:hypothetical protein